MALSNSQYDQLMRMYERRQLDNERRLRERYDRASALIPELKEVDEQISSESIAQAKRRLTDDAPVSEADHAALSRLFERKRELLIRAGLGGDYLDPHYTCPDCKDTGFIGTEKCHCFEKAAVELLYMQSNLRDILTQENFSAFCLNFYSGNHIDPLTGRSSLESAQTALRTCRGFVDSFSDTFSNLLLYGDTGVGKTFLTHCIAKEIMDSGRSVIYFSASQLFDYFAENTFGKKNEQSADAFNYIYNCDLLIIDDLGTEFSNFFTSSQLFVCLNERLLRRRSTVISTNLSLDDINANYSERIFSRISSSYTILRLTGDDIRIQKKLLNMGGTYDAAP